MSASRFTGSPTFRKRRFVDAKVCGITATPNDRSVQSHIVRLMPSTATEPLSTRYGEKSSGTSKVKRQPSPTSRMPATRPAVSTCPNTKCPLTRSPTRSERSTLTTAPGASRPRVVRASVSSLRSAMKPCASSARTVRQTPFVAMLSPVSRSPGSKPPWTVSTASAPERSIAWMRPCAVMMPANTAVAASARDESRDGPRERRAPGLVGQQLDRVGRQPDAVALGTCFQAKRRLVATGERLPARRAGERLGGRALAPELLEELAVAELVAEAVLLGIHSSRNLPYGRQAPIPDDSGRGG